MRKKYLSALLFGALVMASTATFTSCKDYDDDIDQVNTNVNAVKSDLSSKMDAVNTSISGLTSAQSEIKGSLSAVNKQIETLTADGAKAVAELKAELQKADADQKAALEAKIAELNTKLEEQVDALAKQAALLSAQDEQITAALADLEAVKAQIVSVNAALEEKIAQNVTDIETLNEITATLSATVDANMAEVVGKITAMETALTNHEVAIESILVTLDGIDGQIAAIKAVAGDNTAAIETLKADIETLKKEMEEKIVASHDAIRAEISKVDSDLNARIDKLTETVLAGQATMTEALANQLAALELQKTALEEYKAAMEAADLDRDGKIGANAETIAANKEAADKAIADLSTLLEAEVKGLNDKIDALDERIKALEAGVSEADWQTIKKEIEDANKEVTTAYEAADQVLEGKINTLETTLRTAFGNDLVTLTSSVNTMVTNVAFAAEIPGVQASLTQNFKLMTAIQKGTTFGGNGIANTITFTDGDQYQVGGDFYIRVSPASATITPDMISLVNTQGGSLDGIVKVKSVERYNGLLSRAANIPNGIWKVSVEAINYNESTFKAATKDANDDDILFAVAIDSKAGSNENESRAVVSPFTLGFEHKDYTAVRNLSFKVNGTDVANIQNRYGSTDLEDANTKELVWKAPTAQNPTPSIAGNANNTEEGDDRSGKTLLPAVQSENIKIELTGDDVANIRAMYVTLDKAFTTADDPSEIVAWEAYQYTNLNTVVEGKEINIKVDSERSIRDIIGFRVYAVNYDGTLVDPDGKAFYVKIGMDGVTIPATETVVYATAPSTAYMRSEAYTFAANTFKNIRGIDKVATVEWKADGLKTPGGSGNFMDANGFGIELLKSDGAGGYTSLFTTDYSTNVLTGGSVSFAQSATGGFYNLKDVVAIKTYFNRGMRVILDEKKLNGTLTLKDADGFVIATLKVSATKKLPTTAPAADNFSVKSGQIVNGIHYAYLIPDTSSPVNGTQDMTHVFNGWGTDYASGTDGYRIVFDNVYKQGNDWVDMSFGKAITIPASAVDNATEHATWVRYVYNNVSCVADQAGTGTVVSNKEVLLNDFNTVFCSIFHENVMHWNWSTGEQMGWTWDATNEKWMYNGVAINRAMPKDRFKVGADDNMGLAAIFGTNDVNATDYSKNLNDLMSELDFSTAEAHLISNGNQVVDEYFTVRVDASTATISWTHKTDTSNPTTDVASTLKLTVKDKFGKTVNISVPVTVKKR